MVSYPMKDVKDVQTARESLRMRLTVGALRYWLKRQSIWRRFKTNSIYACPIAKYLHETTGADHVGVTVEHVIVWIADNKVRLCDTPPPLGTFIRRVDRTNVTSIGPTVALRLLKDV